MSAIISHLAQTLGTDIIQFHAPYVWLYKSGNKAIVIKMEHMEDDTKLFVNASFSRDGGGPLLASFMSMLMIEDIHATSADPIGLCSGEASITLYHILDISEMDERHLLYYLHNFETLAACILEQAQNEGDSAALSPRFLSRLPAG